MEVNKVYCMDNREGLKQLEDNSIDSIVTDPPYELGFMGKKWDASGIAYNVNLWKECLRVLKPGGHLLSFGGSRTYHRMACAIEDAGFEIRDCIMWLYGSGFPKSHDISKAIDKAAGAEREDAIKGGFMAAAGRRTGVETPNANAMLMERTIPSIVNKGALTKGTPATPEATQWNGWGTALKPAHEPIVLARKPLSESTVAANVLKWGTGGLNIDGCRIGTEKRVNPQAGFIRRGRTDEEIFLGTDKNRPQGNLQVQGRFPANLLFDEEAAAMLDEQSGMSKSVRSQRGAVEIFKKPNGWIGATTERGHDDSGGASRFFYVAKASKKERGEGNNHPTVKPITLIRYLTRLVTPPGGTVLDPFLGSGTTALACEAEGFN